MRALHLPALRTILHNTLYLNNLPLIHTTGLNYPPNYLFLATMQKCNVERHS